MTLFQRESGFRLYCLFLLLLFLATSLYGILWISDEFDAERMSFYGFFAIPALLLYFAQIYYRPSWWSQNPIIFWTYTLILICSFLWGHLLWLNGISGSQKSEVNITMHGAKYNLSYRRGGLDWLYKPRW